jgi:hypothetical protein
MVTLAGLSQAAPAEAVIHPLYEVVAKVYDICVAINPGSLKEFILNSPYNYHDWWLRLYSEAPLHVLIETGLVLFIIWLIFIRKTVDPRKSSNREELSKKEIDWLVETWQPEPLVPQLNRTQRILADSMIVSI